MTLREYLELTGLSQREFGKRVGLHQSRISQIMLHGTRDALTIRRIVHASHKAITSDELLPEGTR